MSLTILLNAAVYGMRTKDRLHLLLPRDREDVLQAMDNSDCDCLPSIRIAKDWLNVAVSTCHLERLEDRAVVAEFETRFAAIPLHTGNEPDWEPHDWQPLLNAA